MIKRTLFFQFIGLVMIVSACGSGENQQDQSAQSGDVSDNNIEITLTESWATDSTQLVTPECATYDPDRDVFYVSNLNRDNDAENDGFISLVNADGSIGEARWVEGLGSPLGNDFYNGHLYVSDNDKIVKIDMESGDVVEEISVEGASNLNGIDIDGDGNIYVADSDGNKVFRVDPEGNSTLISEEEGLNRPNGVFVNGNKLLIASSGGNSLLSLNLEGESSETLVDGLGRADGIVSLDNGGYFISSWTGAVYFVSEDMQKQKILDTQEQEINAADIGYIPQENLLVVPTFYDNRLVAYEVNFNE